MHKDPFWEFVFNLCFESTLLLTMDVFLWCFNHTGLLDTLSKQPGMAIMNGHLGLIDSPSLKAHLSHSLRNRSNLLIHTHWQWFNPMQLRGEQVAQWPGYSGDNSFRGKCKTKDHRRLWITDRVECTLHNIIWSAWLCRAFMYNAGAVTHDMYAQFKHTPCCFS